MKSQGQHRCRIATILLALYLMIFTASVLHVHDYGHKDYVCQDCISHIKHDGHLIQGSLLEMDCVLCNFFQASYVTPQVIVLVAVALVVIACIVRQTQDVVCCTVSLPNLRAPPVMC